MYWIKSLLNLNHKSFATHWWELPQRFCHDKCTFVMTKHVFCRDKNMLVATNILVMAKLLSRQTHVCHNKTHLCCCEKVGLSQQNTLGFCCCCSAFCCQVSNIELINFHACLTSNMFTSYTLFFEAHLTSNMFTSYQSTFHLECLLG